MEDMEIKYHFGYGLFNIKNMKTRRNGILPVSFLTLGIDGSPILSASARYTRCQLIRRIIEEYPGVVRPLLNEDTDINKIQVSSDAESFGSTSAGMFMNRMNLSMIFNTLKNMIIEVVDEDMKGTHFVFSSSERWNHKILDYAIQPYLFRNVGKEQDIEGINDSLGYVLKQIWNWDDDKLVEFYKKYNYEPALFPLSSQGIYKEISIMDQIRSLSMIECPDSCKRELNKEVRKRIAVFASALYPRIDAQSILLIGTEYNTALTAIKYIKLQYKKYLMVSSKFLKEPSGSLTTAPIFEISQDDTLLNIEVLKNKICVIYPEEIGYDNKMLGKHTFRYPETTEISNMQLLLD